jgi:hypothetical protein
MNIQDKYHCYSGGAAGSDIYWEKTASKYGIHTTAFSFDGHKHFSKNPYIMNFDELFEGHIQCKMASYILKRRYPTSNNYTNNLLRRNWFQIKHSDASFAIGYMSLLKGKKLILGGTGWAAAMTINANKPLFFYNQDNSQWMIYMYEINDFRETDIPVLTKKFAGIGTRDLKENGKRAIQEIFKNTFNHE